MINVNKRQIRNGKICIYVIFILLTIFIDKDDDTKFNVLEGHLQNISTKDDSDVEKEYLIAAEKRNENKRLRKLGIKRKKCEKAEAALESQLDYNKVKATQ